MNIIKEGNNIRIMTEKQIRNQPYNVTKGQNGRNYVTKDSVCSNILHVSEGNTKTGEKCVNFNLPIEYTCNHCFECYKNAVCYAEQGCYMYANNQAMYTENYNFYKNNSPADFVQALQLAINEFGFKFFRYFTCGDIPNNEFINCMVAIAKNNPGIEFWSYTKKYQIVNNWINNNGDLPDNLVIIFSHWLNENGTYAPMDNPHNLPTSEFIPFGKEYLAENVTYICPCSDPTVKATCITCEHPCFRMKKGQSQGLMEHSTIRTKERDKAIKAAKNAL